jgi:DNA modification methylase
MKNDYAHLTVRKMPISRLKEHPSNPRVHPQPGSPEWETLRKSLENDYFDPCVVNERNGFMLVSGHMRVKVLREMGVKHVDCVIVDYPEDVHLARMIAANKQIGDWNDATLTALLQQCETPALTGYTDEQIQALLGQTAKPSAADAEPQTDRAGELRAKYGVERGQVWVLGSHRLMCGDSTNRDNVAMLIGNDRAGLMNTDPPYGVSYVNQDRPNPGVAKGRVAKGRVANDDLCDENLQAFLENAFKAALDIALKPNAAWYMWHAHLTQGYFAAAAAAAAADVILHRQIIWVKPVLLLGRGQYHWKHEPCFMGWVKGNQPPDYGLGNGERTQTTIWEVNSISNADRKDFEHSTPKPLGLFTVPIVKHLMPGEVCYEPFCGTGPQIIAAEQTGRQCRAMEISPEYVAISIQRWADATGKTPELAKTS